MIEMKTTFTTAALKAVVSEKGFTPAQSRTVEMIPGLWPAQGTTGPTPGSARH